MNGFFFFKFSRLHQYFFNGSFLLEKDGLVWFRTLQVKSSTSKVTWKSKMSLSPSEEN